MKTMYLLVGCVLLICTSAFSQQAALIQKDNAFTLSTEISDRTDSELRIGQNGAQHGVHLFPKRSGELDWGLALSGGGIRSAAFSIGAMKALYEIKDTVSGVRLLDKIDVISSVSGGGYASYWLFTNYARNKERTQKFGEAALNSDTFIGNVCELQNVGKSQFIPGKSLLRILLKGSKGFEDYKVAIERSFGNGTSPDLTLEALQSELGDVKAPYLIINTTVEGDKRKSSKVFELSPHFRGNPAMGFRDWQEEDKDKPSFSKGIAMSGAPRVGGIIGIKGEIYDFRQGSAVGQRLSLWDGGQSENLGALALIRRGIKNIIIVDSEADPAYKFDAYLKLQKMLKKDFEVEFCVPNIEVFLKKSKKPCPGAGIEPDPFPKGKRERAFSASSVSKGKAWSTGNGLKIESFIHYMKMSDPAAIVPALFSDEELFKAGERLAKQRETERCRDFCENSKSDCCCSNIKLTLETPEERKAFYAYQVKEYSVIVNKPKFRHNRALWFTVKLFHLSGKTCYFVSNKTGIDVLGTYVCSLLSYNFPHTTTLDQSLFSDQLEAFVGLGYLQMMEGEAQLLQRTY